MDAGAQDAVRGPDVGALALLGGKAGLHAIFPLIQAYRMQSRLFPLAPWRLL
jgi:hypothetical protein